MKAISAALESHLAGETTTLATCWKATLANATVYGFTSHSDDILFGGVNYLAATGHTPTAIASNDNLAVDNLDVIGFLDSSVITEAAIRAGLWDYAAIEIFQVNWADTSQGALKLRAGRLGEIRTTRQQFTAELRGLAQNMQQIIGQLYSSSCRADFGDAKCTKPLGPLTVTGAVTTGGVSTFSDSGRAEASDYFGAGKVTFTGGLNNGLSMEIKQFAAGAFVLVLPMPNAIGIGDTYSAIPGCRKRFATDCKIKFNNVVNFRGEPSIPGNDQLAAQGGA